MARALTEEPKETEEETATDVVNFQGCVLVMCFFALILLFCFKMPWYSRVFVHLFAWCVCCSFSFLIDQFAFCEALLTSLKHISLLSNENSLKKTQNSNSKLTSQKKHPTKQMYTQTPYFFPYVLFNSFHSCLSDIAILTRSAWRFSTSACRVSCSLSATSGRCLSRIE